MAKGSKCPHCGAPVAAAEPICLACGKIQPPPPAGARPDKFATLGFDPSFDEPDGLDERFRALSRKMHPDRFVRATAQERRYSLEQTMEDREKLLEAKVSGQPLDALAAGVREKRDQTLREVRNLVENGGDLSHAAELLARMRYYARYLDEVEGRSAEL